MTYLKVLRGKTAWGETKPSIFLVLNTFVWFTLTNAIFNAILNGLNLFETEKLSLFAVYFMSIAASAVFGSKFFSRARANLLYFWLFMGATVTSFLITISSSDILADVLLAIFLGISIGIGFPSCLSYFADSTHIENRGFIGGITWSGVGFAVLFLAVLFSGLAVWEAIAVLAIWRLLGGFGFVFLTRQNQKPNVQKSLSYSELVRKREILLYLFPWIMFSLINFAEEPLLERVFGSAVFAFVGPAEYAFIGVFAVVGGIVADVVGRKRVVITGFVMLGIEYAVLSSGSPATLYLFMTLDGVTWGLFSSVFLTAIWGDLGEGHQKEKYYVLGGLPFLLASFVSILISPYASHILLTAAFSLASFFLFLAVIPLMYAPETLPEKTIRDRELNQYIEQAKKAKEKYAKS